MGTKNADLRDGSKLSDKKGLSIMCYRTLEGQLRVYDKANRLWVP